MTAPVLLPRQVAKLLHISPQKVTAMCRAGQIKAPTVGNDEVGISIIPCGTSLINSLGQIDDALTCSLEPARVIWYGASGRCAYVERQALGQSRSVTGIGSRHTVHLMLFRPLSCLHGSPPSFGLDKGSSFGWGLLHVGFNVGFIWPCTTRREFVV
jgi:hypothetical protein